MAVVCRAVAGLKSYPNDHSELLTQEIFGNRLEVSSLRGDWAECTLSDGYTGWLPIGAISMDRPYTPTHIVVRRFGRIRVRGATDFFVPMGSLVEATGRSGSEHVVGLPDGKRGTVDRNEVRKLAALPWGLNRFGALVREVEGTPYVWGGKSTFGFDCSGLVQFMFGFLGVALPRDSRDQAAAGTRVGGLAGLRKYDLMFFATKREIDHVAVHLGDLRILHASGHVRIESLKEGSRLFRLDLAAALKAIRRVIDV
jgi:hypothetical protein